MFVPFLTTDCDPHTKIGQIDTDSLRLGGVSCVLLQLNVASLITRAASTNNNTASPG